MKLSLSVLDSLSRKSLAKAWRESGPWKKVFLSIFALLSIVAIHYAGFVSGLPYQIRDVAGHRFASACTGIFMLYFVVAAAFARVITFLLAPAIIVFVGLLVRLSNFRNRTFARKYLRLQQGIDRLTLPYTAVLTTVTMIGSYGYYKNGYATFYIIGIGMLFAAIAGFRALLLKPSTARTQLGFDPRGRRRNATTAALIYLAIGTAVTISLLLGMMRFQRQIEAEDVRIATQCAVLSGRVLVANESEFLVVTGRDKEKRYFLLGKDFIVGSSPTTSDTSFATCHPK